MTKERNIGYLWFVASLICVAGWVVELSSEHAQAAEQDARGSQEGRCQGQWPAHL